MPAIQVKNAGVKFTLHHQKTTTLMETLIGFVHRRGNVNPLINPSHEAFWALKNISFSVKQGEAFAIIGKNGAGKSTLLQILSGIYKPDEGTVEKKGRVGLLQIGTGFHPELSGRDNIYLNGAILGLRKKEIDIIYNAIVSFSELERFIDTPIKNYSTGMVTRLGFSIAINVRPDILLIDEVLSVGDESFRNKCKQKLGEIRASGKTIVFVSHAMGEVKQLCDRAICLENGRIVFEGPSGEASDFYLKSQNGKG